MTDKEKNDIVNEVLRRLNESSVPYSSLPEVERMGVKPIKLSWLKLTEDALYVGTDVPLDDEDYHFALFYRGKRSRKSTAWHLDCREEQDGIEDGSPVFVTDIANLAPPEKVDHVFDVSSGHSYCYKIGVVYLRLRGFSSGVELYLNRKKAEERYLERGNIKDALRWGDDGKFVRKWLWGGENGIYRFPIGLAVIKKRNVDGSYYDYKHNEDGLIRSNILPMQVLLGVSKGSDGKWYAYASLRKKGL